VYVIQVSEGTYLPGGVANFLWAVGVVAIGFAVWSPSQEERPHRRHGWAVLIVPSLFTAISLAFLILDRFMTVNLVTIGLATTALCAAILRTALTLPRHPRAVGHAARGADRRADRAAQPAGVLPPARQRGQGRRRPCRLIAGRRATTPTAARAAVSGPALSALGPWVSSEAAPRRDSAQAELAILALDDAFVEAARQNSSRRHEFQPPSRTSGITLVEGRSPHHAAVYCELTARRATS